MKSIYILLTRSTTICSRIVYMATRSEFTHAAISLDRNFDKLYTFGRKYKRLMLPAGFVRRVSMTAFWETRMICAVRFMRSRSVT